MAPICCVKTRQRIVLGKKRNKRSKTRRKGGKNKKQKTETHTQKANNNLHGFA